MEILKGHPSEFVFVDPSPSFGGELYIRLSLGYDTRISLTEQEALDLCANIKQVIKDHSNNQLESKLGD